MFRRKEKMCRDCVFAKYHNADFILGCGFRCYLNPFRPVTMGLLGRCSERKRNKSDQYQKTKKDS